MRLPRTLQPPRARHTPAPWRSRPRSATRALLVAIALVTVVALGATVRSVIDSGSGEASASAELALLREQVSPLLVYSEFGQWADTIWAAGPDDPANRAYVATVEHQAGYGISAGLSPNGAYVAYTVLPRDSASAELWLLEVGASSARRLAEGVDLRSAPVWSPASDSVVVRRPLGEYASALIQVDLGGATSLLAQAEAGLYPIAFSPDSTSFYYATLSAAGADLVRASPTGPPQPVAHLSDAFARDWRLSPDGGRLAYLAQTGGDALSYRAQVLDIDGGQAGGAIAGDSGSQFSPVWHPAGGLTIGREPAGETSGAAVLATAGGGEAASQLLPAPDTGFDVPLSWSPDGDHLVVRGFEGASAADPGPSHVVVIGPAGARRQLSPLSDVLVVGWLE